MRVLVIHNNFSDDPNKHSAVDEWRLIRPMRELRKHRPDWTIDERPTVIPDIAKYKDKSEFTEAEMEAAFENICTYDIVFSSYQANPTIYTLLKVAESRAGTQYIMDCDDDMFAINPDNPVWTRMTDEKIYYMQRMIADNTWISTTTDALAKVFRLRRKGHHYKSVFVNPNYISDDYKHNGFNNKDRLVIGYCGGSSHYKDIHDSGFLPALARVMHENKHVYFRSIGMIVDTYLPKARYKVEDGKKGPGYLSEVFPSFNFDIAAAPILDNIFNTGKSDIKWQEYTRAGAAVIASDIGPYTHLPPGSALLVKNTEEAWYEALTRAVNDAGLRKKLITTAQKALHDQYRLEDNWMRYEAMFEAVMAAKNAKQSPVILSK